MTWQSRERNQWATAVRETLAPDGGLLSTGDQPFSLSDPDVVTGPRAVRAIGLQQVRGKAGRANASEPLMTPR
jgi:hypothetical protein